MGKLIVKTFAIFAILFVIIFLSFWRWFLLHGGATLISQDNILSNRMMMSNCPYILGGLLLGAALCYFIGKRSSIPKTGRATSRLLFMIAGALLIISVLWDISLVRFINSTLSTRYPEMVQYGYTPYVSVLLFGCALFGLAVLLVSVVMIGRKFTLMAKAVPGV